MREVRVFLCPSVYRDNAAVIENLEKNDISVSCLDVQKDDYTDAVDAHFARNHAIGATAKRQPLFCLCFEDSRAGIAAAKDAGMSTIGIASNRIEYERLSSEGAHAVALSMSEFLDAYCVRNYYQIMYLPYILNLRPMSVLKAGYPVSLLDTLSGRFNKPTDSDYAEELIEIDENAQRIIPREILGVTPGSLADDYINNIGWPHDNAEATFRLETREVERDVIRIFSRYYGYPESWLRGYVTSGGTEGNFTGLWWNRDYLQNRCEGRAAILITSQQAHYSVKKAAQQLAIEVRFVGTTNTGAIDCDKFASLLDKIAQDEPDRPVMVNVNIGTTQTGAIDDLPGIHALLMDKVKARDQVFAIHMDAALLGAVLPIVKPFGDVDYFKDFGVNTIAISGHKFFGSVCICGLCLTTAPFLNERFSPKENGVAYLNGLHDQTPSGSRSGFVALSFHNTLCGLYMHTDANRLKQIVAQCYQNTDYFIEKMTVLVGGDKVIHPKNALVVCFPRPSTKFMVTYQLMPVSLPDTVYEGIDLAGVCVLINFSRKRIDRFVIEYAKDRKSC